MGGGTSAWKEGLDVSVGFPLSQSPHSSMGPVLPLKM